MSRRVELAAYAALGLLALLLRLLELGDRPFHHDESQDAYFSWIFFTSGEYRYQPILHGPLRFYLTAAAYGILGDTDVTARLVPALMGTAMVALPYGLRGLLGRGACLVAAAALTVGPSYLYFSRFAREDIYIACITLALIVVVFRFLAGPLRHHPALIGSLLALSFATKESTFITVFVAGTFFLARAAWEVREVRRAGGDPRSAPLLAAVGAVGARAWFYGLVAFAGVFTLLFTTFLTNPGGLWDGLYGGLAYWLGQHDVRRGGEAWFFYLVLLFGHEWPMLLLGALGAWVALRRRGVLDLFLVWFFVGSLAVYSWAGEKFAWLALHPLLPLLLLAGIGAQALWQARRLPGARAGLAVAGAGAVYLLVASWSVNVLREADPREFLVSTQSSPEVQEIAAAVRARAEGVRRAGGTPRIIVDAAEGATFPWAWYFRDLPVAYLDLTADDADPPAADALILTQGSRARLAPALAGFEERRFAFRVWWVRDYAAQSPGAWARWFTRREPWNPVGGMPEWLYLRRAASTSQTTVP